jgi:stress-induced morphogen
MSMEIIKQKLEKAFPGAKIELFSTASQHIGHASGLHLKTIIESQAFEGKTLIKQKKKLRK